MRTSRFWKAFETLGGAGPQRDWARALGTDWALAGALLRRTGDIAEDLVCPRSSENGCLRHLVQLPDGKFRADCGDVPQRCDTLRLEKDEVRILALDICKLASGLIRAFGLQDGTAVTTPVPVLPLGRYEIYQASGSLSFSAYPRAETRFRSRISSPSFAHLARRPC